MENLREKMEQKRMQLAQEKIMGPSKASTMRDTFLSQLSDYYETGILPETGSKEVRFYLENQAQRLAGKGIGLKKTFDKDKDDISNDIVKSRKPYKASLSIRETAMETEYLRDGKRIKRAGSGADFLYCTVLEKEGEEEQEYTCPNCGHRALLKDFTDGCTMCGTKFEMPQRFPCVTNYYTIPQPVRRHNLQKVLNFTKLSALIGGIGFAIYFTIRFIIVEKLPVWAAILLGLLSGAMAGLMVGVMTYMVTSMVFMLILIPMAVISICSTADMAGDAAAKRKTEAAMKKYDPEFSYEFFEGKALAILRATALSDDRGNLGVYRGSDDLSYMDDIVNIEYRGGVAFQRCGIYNDMIHLNVRAFMSDTYLRDGEIKIYSDTFDLEFVRKPDAVSDIGASVHAVNCKSCGASFDAVKQRKCPHCSSPYELANEDWILIQVKKVK